MCRYRIPTIEYARIPAGVRGWFRALGMTLACLALAGSQWTRAADDLGKGPAESVVPGTAAHPRTGQVHERTLLDEYLRVIRELDALRRYDDHLERMVAGQEAAVAEQKGRLREVAQAHRGIVPLMSRMVDSLVRFIDLDLPFLVEKRRQRARRLQDLVDAPEVSVAEKYRRILEAYRAEAEYGCTVGAYRGRLREDGRGRSVEFLRVGRVVFLYRSLDGAEAGIWDPRSRTWTALPEAYRAGLGKAFRVARKQAAPDLLQLPVPAPESAP